MLISPPHVYDRTVIRALDDYLSINRYPDLEACNLPRYSPCGQILDRARSFGYPPVARAWFDCKQTRRSGQQHMRLILFFAATVAFGGTPKVASDTTVVVFVDGHGRLSGSLWSDVRSLVSLVFKKINVRIEWEYGKISTDMRVDRIPVLLHVATTGPVGNGNPGPTCSLKAFACSLPFDGSHRVIAMYDTVYRTFSDRFKLVPRVLAYAIAHEIVHIVTESAGHSQIGIMKRRWNPLDINSIEFHELKFTESDVLNIQSGLDSHRQRAQSKQ